MNSGTLVKVALDALDRAAKLLGREPNDPEHLVTGRRGEELAYFHLRKLGYTMVARNYRAPRHRGEIDLVGWDGDVLCVVEVKTRSTRGLAPAEAAVDREKEDELRLVAREYLRAVAAETTVRGDVVSVYTDTDPPEINLFKNAFQVR
jgi:putative endonuclease